MNIRPAYTTEIYCLSEIIRRSYSTVAQRFDLTPQNCPKHPSNCTPEWIQTDLDRGVNYYLLEEKTGSIGCAALERADSEICYLERLSVVPERRNEGLGTRLVHHCFREAGAMGITTLGIGIIADQHELRQWYEKLGFVETGRKRFEHLPFEVLFMKSGL